MRLRTLAVVSAALFIAGIVLAQFVGEGQQEFSPASSAALATIRHPVVPIHLPGVESRRNLDEDPEATLARHDLYWTSPEGYGLQWEGESPGLSA